MSPGKAHETYRHECLLYDRTAGFLDAVVPFVRDGLARGEPVMIAVAEPRLQALRCALDSDADQVIFADMAELGHNPALIIPAWREFTEQHSGTGRPVRGIGEPIWATRRPAEIVEAQFHEALLNLAVPPDIPLWLLCPYDASDLDEHILCEAHRSHPVLVESNTYRGSAQYGGISHVEEFFGRPLPEPVGRTTPIVFDSPGCRHSCDILRFSAATDLRLDRAVKLAAAVDEIAGAAARETGDVDIRMWTESGALICEVGDPGTVEDPMIGRGGAVRTRPLRHRALRLANELCDLVQVRSGTAGTTTRVLCWL